MAYPPLDEILPHRPPMLLLDAMTLAEERAVACAVTVRENAPFVEAGKTSSLLAVEYFAQAVAALFAYKARGEGNPEFRGLLLGVRDLDLAVPHFAVGDALEVHCREHWGSGPVAHFQCTLSRGPERLATGAITVLRGDPNEMAARPDGPELTAPPSGPSDPTEPAS